MSDKQMQKSRIAARVSNINTILLVLVLTLMATIAAVIINAINNETSMNLVRAYSMEAAEKFYSYISQDLTLVRKVSHSKAVKAWFADEGNWAKKTAAFDEMMDYTGMLQGTHLYFGIQKSLNEYTIRNEAVLADFAPFGKLNSSVSDDAWYFECAGSENDYTLKIDIEKYSNTWRLWINHKVTVNGNTAGVFCSGLRVPDIFHDIFEKYESKKVRGYIIDRHGIIQSDSTHAEIYLMNLGNHIREENTDPVFASALHSYMGRIDGFFGLHSRPEVSKLSQGSYGYAAIEPIGCTDWSVVVLFNGNALSGVADLLPFLIIMLAALFMYVTGQNALMKRFIFTPLGRLTQSVSEGKSTDADFFGNDRDDEIGDLARTIRDATHKRQRQEQLLHAVNNAASVLLSPPDETNPEAPLLEGLELIGRYVDVDRINIWRNDTIDGVFCYVNQFQWLRNDADRKGSPAVLMRPYSENPEWEIRFLRNEYINGPISVRTRQEQAILEPQGVKSILAIPLYWRKEFYGFFSFDDCRRERTFTEDEVNILRSAGLMIVNALNRNAQTAELNEAHERTKLMLDATPLACRLWNRNFEIFECNDETVKLYGLRDKQEYIKRYFDLSPAYQPGGQDSREETYKILEKVFNEGKYAFEWMHQTLDGTPIPAEITLVRVKYGDEYVIAGYTRDLREHRRMMDEIERRDALLHVMNRAAAVLLVTENDKDFEASLLEGMELVGRCLDVDRVQIWRNETVDGDLYFVHKYQWLSDTGQQAVPVPIDLKFPYSAKSEWENRFLRGEYINGPLSEQSPDDQNFLNFYNIKSIVIIPLFLQNRFWGFFSIDDCRRERTFTEDEIDIMRSGSLMMVSALNRNIQAAQLRQAHENTQVLLDTMPLTCNLFSRDAKIIDCNAAAVNLLKTKDKQEYIDSFWDLVPEYQSDGRLSVEKGSMLINKAFDEGRCASEWMHRLFDGTMIPVDAMLVRVKIGGDDVVAGYAWDMREHKQMMEEIERSAHLLNAMNLVATILLQSEIDEFDNNLHRCMGMIAEAVNVDRVCIWKNHTKNERLYCTQIYEWVGNAKSQINSEIALDKSYDESIPGWEKILSQGKCLNKMVRDMSPQEQAELSPRGILSIFVAPVFVHDKFWGFVGFDNCHREILFSESEESTLRSGSLLIANALLRHDMTLSIRATAAQLEAVIAGYAGIIWCVDQNSVITLFNGQYLNELGFTPDFFEDKKLDDALKDERFSGILASVDKTFTDGPQDLNIEIDGKMYRIRTTPIYDDSGGVVNVVGSFDDVTERSRLQRELKEALREAQEANHAKSNFLARMSHEMRTPLNAVIGLSELTLEDNGLSKEVQLNLEKINSSGSTLLSTVNDILDISKIEAGKFEVISSDYDIPSLINDAITQSIMRIGEKSIRFRLDIDENLPTRLRGDDLRVKQILNNLLSNAFKYTMEGT
ncbi:MAG: GAF domain-containing protein, partial [Leptospirales bacterium]|nr:GAF domain-containing protein [Leptospirales bacterium]